MSFERFLTRLASAGLLIASAAVLVMMVVGAGDTAATFFGHPIPGALELAELLMVIIVFLALPDAEANNKHIAIDLVSSRLPHSLSKPLFIFAAVLSLCFYGAMAWQAWRLFAYSWSIGEFTAGLVKFPVYPAKGLLVAALAVVTAVALMNVVRSLFGSGNSSKPIV